MLKIFMQPIVAYFSFIVRNCLLQAYNLKISKLMKIKKTIKKQQKYSKHKLHNKSWIILRNFFIAGKSNYLQKQQNRIKVSIYFFLVSLALFHTLMTQQLLSSESYRQVILAIFEFVQGNKILNSCFLSLIILIKFFLIISVVMELIAKMEVFGLSQVTKKVMNSYKIIKQFDLFFSALMTTINWQQNLSLLFLSSLINIFQAIYLQNYAIRKDYLYASSVSHYICFRALILFIYFGNIVFLILVKQMQFYIFITFVGMVHLIWYFKAGHQLFPHRFSNSIFLLLNALFFTFYCCIFQQFIQNSPLIDGRQFLKIFLIFMVVIFHLYLRSIPFNNRMPNKQIKSLKAIDIFLNRQLQQTQADKDVNCKLIGMIQMHQLLNYYNCVTLKKELYDPSLKLSIKQEDMYLQKQTILTYYIKQLYEQAIEENFDLEVRLDYCQFLCNQYNNLYLIYKQIQKIKNQPLNINQRIKVFKMEQYLQQQNAKVNKELYDNQLQIQHIMESQNCFQDIQDMIKRYIIQNLKLWKRFGQQSIALTQLCQKMQFFFEYLNQIQIHWTKISGFFNINKSWLLIYIHFLLFIKNEKIKQKESDIINSCTTGQDSIFTPQFIQLDPHEKEQTYFKSAILFNQDSSCLIVTHQVKELIIRKVNSRFSRISGYDQEQIVGSKIEALMSFELAKIHQEKFENWLQEGYISNQNQYKIKITQLVAKDKNTIPAVRFYKAYYRIDKGIEFVCLLKSILRPSMAQAINKSPITFIKRRSNKDQFINSLNSGLQFSSNEASSALLSSNIFVKQESLQPNESFQDITRFNFFARMFTVSMLASILILSAVTQADSTLLNSYSHQFNTFMTMYRQPVVLGINYMKNFLNIGNITKANAQIKLATNSMLVNSAATQTKLTLFDTDLNSDKIYYPYYNYSFLKNDSQGRIDLFYMMISTISTLNQPAINRTSQDFQRFNSYLKPAYDTMMNTTKYKLHQTFSNIFSQSITNQIWVILVQATLFGSFMILLFCIVRSFMKKMRNILAIFFEFTPHQIVVIHNYWKQVGRNFNLIFLQLHYRNKSPKEYSLSNLKNIQLQQSGQQIQSIVNKRPKEDAKQDKAQKRLEIKLKAFIILIMIIIISLTSFIEFKMMNTFQYLKQFENDGFFFLKYFPCGPIVALGCLEKYYFQQYPQQLPFNPKKYDDALLATFRFGFSNDYIGDVAQDSSSYYTKQKQYFYGNPCEYNPAILASLNITTQRCLAVCNSTFKQGLSSYLRYVYKFGLMYFNNEIVVTPAQLDEFTLGTSILSSYVLDVMNTWTHEFTSQVQSVQNTNLNTCLLILGVVIILHLIINELSISKSLCSQYNFIKKIYFNLVPEFILISQKVIRQKFIIEGLVPA